MITPRLHRTHHIDDSSATNLETFFSFRDRLHRTLNLAEQRADVWFGNGEADYPQQWRRQFIAPFLNFSKH